VVVVARERKKERGGKGESLISRNGGGKGKIVCVYICMCV
jgi:hypothetical protein